MVDSKINSNSKASKLLEVYYVDDFGGRVPDSWLGVGGSPDDCWHRIEVYEE